MKSSVNVKNRLSQCLFFFYVFLIQNVVGLSIDFLLFFRNNCNRMILLLPRKKTREREKKKTIKKYKPAYTYKNILKITNKSYRNVALRITMAFYSVCDNINKVIQKLIKKCDRKISLLLTDFKGNTLYKYDMRTAYDYVNIF